MIVGIDLGTTNSLISAWRDGQAILFPNPLGEVLTPSCVSIDEDGSILVGQAARDRLQTHPERSASVFKRYMGSGKQLTLARREFRPEELSALVLKALKADAEAALGTPVSEAVITVPAYFSEAQRRATRVAGQLAGLKVERLLNEPTAAALAHGMHEMGDESRFLVFDLGGGTFDVSILELFEGVMEVRATAGDNFLGGEDVVLGMVDLFFERNRLPASWRQDKAFMQRLIAQAEAAKRRLSTQGDARMALRHDGAEHTLALNEPELEQLCAPLLKRLRVPVERALRDAKVRGDDLDKIVLAGGATRMPMVRRLVTLMFGRFPSVEIDPDQVVALGAAVLAGLQARDASLREVVMTDVCPYSLGVEVSRQLSAHTSSPGHFDPVIERNTPVPVSRVQHYFPVRDQQALVELNVFQGEARLVKDNIPLGRLTIDLPAADSRSENGVAVRFTYDVNGLLQVEATPMKSGETFSLVIENESGLSAQEIAERLAALSDLKIHPRDRMENRALMARADRLYEQLRGELREWFGIQTLQFEQLLATQEPRQIDAGRRRFQALMDEVERDSALPQNPGEPA